MNKFYNFKDVHWAIQNLVNLYNDRHDDNAICWLTKPAFNGDQESVSVMPLDATSQGLMMTAIDSLISYYNDDGRSGMM
jgi:hypothetical protein